MTLKRCSCIISQLLEKDTVDEIGCQEQLWRPRFNFCSTQHLRFIWCDLVQWRMTADNSNSQLDLVVFWESKNHHMVIRVVWGKKKTNFAERATFTVESRGAAGAVVLMCVASLGAEGTCRTRQRNRCSPGAEEPSRTQCFICSTWSPVAVETCQAIA